MAGLFRLISAYFLPYSSPFIVNFHNSSSRGEQRLHKPWLRRSYTTAWIGRTKTIHATISSRAANAILYRYTSVTATILTSLTPISVPIPRHLPRNPTGASPDVIPRLEGILVLYPRCICLSEISIPQGLETGCVFVYDSIPPIDKPSIGAQAFRCNMVLLR